MSFKKGKAKYDNTFSPVQNGCVQLRMDGYLQANEKSTDKMS